MWHWFHIILAVTIVLCLIAIVVIITQVDCSCDNSIYGLNGQGVQIIGGMMLCAAGAAVGSLCFYGTEDSIKVYQQRSDNANAAATAEALVRSTDD
jgi:ApbE superfamily uncharacterized protein (UPF0280 family)